MLIVDVHFTFLILFKNGEIMIFHVVLLGVGKYIEMYTAKFVILVFCFGGFFPLTAYFQWRLLL